MADSYETRRFDTQSVETVDRDILEAIPYAYSGRQTMVEYILDEFTSVCPWSGLPDFGILRIRYIPQDSLIELKSLKYYLLSYRNVGILQEHVVNAILDDLTDVCNPVSMEIEGDFNVRGGLGTVVRAVYPYKRRDDTD